MRAQISIGLAMFIVNSGTLAATGDKLDRTNLIPTFTEDFHGPLSWCGDTCNGEVWRTRYSYGANTPQSRGVGMDTESEVYMDQDYLGLGTNPFLVENDILTIKVRPARPRLKNAVNNDWPLPLGQGNNSTPQFLAGMLTTEKSFQQQYGYFEERAKVPALVGGWPSFWLWNVVNGRYNEIDAMEILTGDPTTLYNSAHWGANGGQVNGATETVKRSDLSKAFHIYGVMWTPTDIIYYLDNREVNRIANPGINDPMYMITAIGTDGDWNSQMGFHTLPTARAEMKIDYVHAYAIGRD
jgi:serralysin